MLSGNILDVYPRYESNTMVTWLLQDGKAVRVEAPYEPSFYVHTPSKDVSKVANALEVLPQVKRLQLTPAKLMLGSPNHTMVLEVVPKSLTNLHSLATLIDSWGGFQKYHLFNVDVRFPTRFLQDHGVFCHGWVTWDGKRFSCRDEQWALDYDIPAVRTLHLDITTEQGRIPSFHEPLPAITLDDEVIKE